VAPGPGVAAILAELGVAERATALALVTGRATVDELVAALGLPVATVLGTLTLLEMRGLARSAYGRYRPAGRLATVDPAAGRALAKDIP
ncbi:MAG: DprA-like winged helix domain-containing protein, partial [Candidatus Limnocylindrales bacterium]